MYDEKNSNIVTRLTQLEDFKHIKNDRQILLTFDDGPSRCLPKLLKILEAEEVCAIFFWQSRLLHPRRPWKQVLESGHLIGTHTCNHASLTKLSYEEQYQQLYYSKLKIEAITGHTIKYFRPPFGQFNDITLKAANELHLTPVLWHISSMDWLLKNRPIQIVENVLCNCENGSIILLHELEHTCSILQTLIRELKQNGFTFPQPVNQRNGQPNPFLDKTARNG